MSEDGIEKPLKSEVKSSLDAVLKKAPQEPAMRDLMRHLNNAAQAAASGNERKMTDHIKVAYGYANAVGRKVDILVEVEDAVDKIRSSIE